ncbi:MAG: 50S ribosomal protein L5 [Chlamydiae bacterium]|nr:50S ribosomal protein L5 [Chlamydiota bacterium]MBI3266293.1 50S ribosomal protein L5 [Chlamydiota bacterium]
MENRVLKFYREKVVPDLAKRLNFKNALRVPRLVKIVLNMGVQEAIKDFALLESHAQELGLITGQKAVITRAKKSIAGFKLREGDPIGCKVTLRGSKMYEFMDRFVSVVLPRIRDFKGLSPKSFDGRGNYNLGLQEQVVFPEIELDKIKQIQGMDVTFVTSAKTNEEAKELLTALGMPFKISSKV